MRVEGREVWVAGGGRQAGRIPGLSARGRLLRELSRAHPWPSCATPGCADQGKGMGTPRRHHTALFTVALFTVRKMRRRPSARERGGRRECGARRVEVSHTKE